MSTEQTKALNPLKKLEAEIAQAQGVRGVMALAEDRFVKNYALVTGKKDGKQRFETEVLNYLDIVNEKPDLRNAEKFSHFSSIMKAATTGLSFKSDGHLYPIAYSQGDKKVVKVQIGAHGKREMMNQMKDVAFMPEAVIVMKGDDFRYDKLNSKVTKHETTDKSSTRNSLEDVVAAYSVIEWKDGRKTFVVVYHEELKKAKDASKNKGPNSVWETWPLEMAKKVTYHRMKKLYHRYPDGVLDFGGEAKAGDGDELEETTDVHYATVDSSQEETTTTNQKAEEVFQEAEVVNDVPKADKSKADKKKKSADEEASFL
jgi:phage RecT family recombinase